MQCTVVCGIFNCRAHLHGLQRKHARTSPTSSRVIVIVSQWLCFINAARHIKQFVLPMYQSFCSWFPSKHYMKYPLYFNRTRRLVKPQQALAFSTWDAIFYNYECVPSGGKFWKLKWHKLETSSLTEMSWILIPCPFVFCIVGGGVQTGSTRHVGHLLAYCTCPFPFSSRTVLQ
jgi:hypothetical protein